MSDGQGDPIADIAALRKQGANDDDVEAYLRQIGATEMRPVAPRPNPAYRTTASDGSSVTSGPVAGVKGRGGRDLIPASEMGRLASGAAGLKNSIQADFELMRQQPQAAPEANTEVRKAARAANPTTVAGAMGGAFMSNINSPFLPGSADAATTDIIDKAAADGVDLGKEYLPSLRAKINAAIGAFNTKDAESAASNARTPLKVPAVSPLTAGDLIAGSAAAGDVAGNIGLGPALSAGSAATATGEALATGARAVAKRIGLHAAKGAVEMTGLGATGATLEGDQESGGKPSLGAGARFIASKEGGKAALMGGVLGGGMTVLSEAGRVQATNRAVQQYKEQMQRASDYAAAKQADEATTAAQLQQARAAAGVPADGTRSYEVPVFPKADDALRRWTENAKASEAGREAAATAQGAKFDREKPATGVPQSAVPRIPEKQIVGNAKKLLGDLGFQTFDPKGLAVADPEARATAYEEFAAAQEERERNLYTALLGPETANRYRKALSALRSEGGNATSPKGVLAQKFVASVLSSAPEHERILLIGHSDIPYTSSREAWQKAQDIRTEAARAGIQPTEPNAPTTPSIPDEQMPASLPTITSPLTSAPPVAPPVAEARAPKAPERPAIDGHTGTDTQVILSDGQKLAARYRVVDAAELQTSHHHGTFLPNAEYPEGVQGRDYTANKSAQEAVRGRALNYDADRALNPSQSAGEGPPTIAPDGTVIAGNDRTMSFRLASEIAPERIRDYFESLHKRAAEYGLDPAEIEQMASEGKIPVLVRELSDPRDTKGGTERWSEINQKSDDVTVKAKSTVEGGAARAKRLLSAGDALTHFQQTIEPGQTIPEYLRTAYGKEFVRQLKESGVFSREEMGAFEDKGVLNDAGRDAIRQMMRATIVDNPALLADADPKIAAKLEGSVASVASVRDTKFGGIVRGVTNALEALRRAREQGVTLEQLDAQGGFLDASMPPALVDLAKFLRDKSPTEVREAFERYAKLGRETLRNESNGDMFGGEGMRSPGQAFAEAFGTENEYGDLDQSRATDSGKGSRKAKGSEFSLFGSDNLFGEPATMGESDVGRAQTSAPKLQGAPELPGAIDPAEMAARRGELGFPKSEAEATAGEDQGRLLDTTETDADQSAAADAEKPRSAADQKRVEQAVATKGASPGSTRAKLAALEAKRLAAIKAVMRPGDSVEIEQAGRKVRVLAPDTESIFDVKMWKQKLRPVLELFSKLYNPERLGKDAKDMAGIAGHWQAEEMERRAQLEYLTGEMSRRVARLTRAKQIELNNAMEGDNWDQPWAKDLAAKIDPRLPALVDAMQGARERLAAELEKRGILHQSYHNFLAHLWNLKGREQEVGAIFSKRPFGGSESFKKTRTHDTFIDGLNAGLKPITYNPIDAQLFKYQELGKSLAAARMIEEAMETGLAKRVLFGAAVPIDANGDRWEVPSRDDAKFTIYGPKSVDVVHRESYDRNLSDAIKQTVDNLHHIRPLEYKRSVNIGAQSSVLGWAQRSGDKMAARLGTSLGTAFHELGHILDFRYDLWTKLTQEGDQIDFDGNLTAASQKERVVAQKELRELADLRDESLMQDGKDNRTKSRTDYVRKQEEKIANVLDFYFSNRERMRRIAPQTTGRLERFLASRPELDPLVKAEAGVEREVNAEVETKDIFGNVTVGHIYMPRGAAQVMRNLVSVGIGSHPLAKAVMTPGRMITQMRLSFSAFHATTIAQEAIYSDMSRKLEQQVNGLKAGKGGSVLTGLLAPVSVAGEALTRIGNKKAVWSLGGKIAKEYLNPGSFPELRPVVDAMKEGGWSATARGDIWTGENLKAMKTAFDTGISNARELQDGNLWRGLTGGTSAATSAFFHALPAAAEAISAPIMAHFVPALKNAATFHAVQQALANLPDNVDVYTRREVVRNIVKEMDYRFGQVNYDNHFMNATAKWAAQVALTAPGWTGGTIALAAKVPGELVGSARTAGKRITGKAITAQDAPMIGSATAYWAASAVALGVSNALITYYFTGEIPHGKDFVMFRNGSKDADGNDNRGLLPGYLTHDIWNYAHHPGKTVANKLSPSVTVPMQLARNRDYFDNEIYDPTSEHTLTQFMGYLGKQALPLSYTNYQESARRGDATAGQKAANFFGITPAHKEDVVTPAQNLLREQEGKMGHPVMTPERVEQGDARRAARAAMRRNDLEPARKLVREGQLTVPQAIKMYKESNQGPEARLAARFGAPGIDVAQAQRIYDAGTEDEKKIWLPALIRKKIAAAKKNPAALAP